MLKIYKSQYKTLSGNTRDELMRKAWAIYHIYEKGTNRRPYVRSNKHGYFHGRKILLDEYMPHLKQKIEGDIVRRIKFFEAGLDLLKHTSYEPIIKKDKKSNEVLLRFGGMTGDGKLFYVQVKQDKRGCYKYMSSFPV